MKTQHTPGPWKAFQDDDYFTIQSIDDRGDIVCRVRIDEDSKRHNADADLIASAPELLEACHRALIHLEIADVERGMQETLRQAIAKAEGKTVTV